jgi:hypothetical protein
LETYTQEHSRNGKRGNNLDLIGPCRRAWSCLFLFNISPKSEPNTKKMLL